MVWNNESGEKCLLEVASLLKGSNLPFFLMQGTALGAWRDRGFVPDEGDIDFGFLHEDLGDKAVEIVSRLMMSQFQVETWCLPFHRCRTIVAWKYGVHVDLVGFIRWKDKRFTCSPVHPSVTEPYSIVHDAPMLEQYRSVELFGGAFNVPQDIEAYLEREYGPDWRTPKKDHVSRTRDYDFIQKEGIPCDFLPPQHQSDT